LMMILPFGAQSLFVINQGLLAGFPRAWVGVATVCCCDSLLIVVGAAGASALLVALGFREVLIACGSAFLVVVGLLTLRAHPPLHADAKRLAHIGVTVAQPVQERMAFAVGSVGASWVWYLMLSLGASILQGRLTLGRRLWIQRISGVLMLIFTGVLAFKLA
jgi:L-lysine exporter family protein LysE/ArgO